MNEIQKVYWIGVILGWMTSIIIAMIITLTFFHLVPSAIGATDLVFKQNTQVDLKVPVFFNGTRASSAAVCNITIFEPDGDTLIDNQLMTNNLAFHQFNLSASQTLNIGEHTAAVYCNDQSFNDFATFQYLISPSGTDDDSLGQLIFLSFSLIFSLGAIWLGFQKEEGWFVMIGGLILVSVGLWTLINGIGLYRNELTQAVSLFVMAIAGFITVRTGIELMGEWS